MTTNPGPSIRAQVVTRRTYNRPLNAEGSVFESWTQTVDRVIGHQRWLWERAKGSTLNELEEWELGELRKLMLRREIAVSGRTLWLGGTDVAKRREASQFNCSFLRVETVHDVVDAQWLLLQGCGVGFEPVVGTLNGFAKPVEVEVVRSDRTIEQWEEGNRGRDTNESYVDTDLFGKRFFWLTIGDSAEAWAKAIGKLLAMKDPVDRVIIDTTPIRAAGIRLNGYGWISSGDEQLVKALQAICVILNSRAGQLLTRIDILDILNWMGTILSSRRSAEIAVMPADDPEAEAFAVAKKDHWLNNPQRAQSNNSLVFYHKPGMLELDRIFDLMREAGGSEPGFLNGTSALARAAWFKGVNPCAEILLGNKSFCNLVEVDWGKFIGRVPQLMMAIEFAARANYRQTCVNLDDGVLQRSWHELNQFLRLCGVGATGIVKLLDRLGDRDEQARILRKLREAAIRGAYSMADELGLPRPKAVSTVKPSGTLSKIMDTTEGVHRPLGKFIFNNIRFGIHDPLVPLLRDAGYRVFADPYATDAVLVTMPVSYEDVEFTKVEVNGRVIEVNTESAIDQLERYKLLMDNYVDHNCSVTISYDLLEVPAIKRWLLANWSSYVGVSFIYRNDPTKTAADLGYPYLPQEVVTEEEFRAYVAQLKPVEIDAANSYDELQEDGCSTGACPIR